MKFGESLSEGLIPEWKDQYVDYKAGKKKIKVISGISDSLNAQKTASASDTTPLLNPADAGPAYASGVSNSGAASTKGGFRAGSSPQREETGPGAGKTTLRSSIKSSIRQYSSKSLSERFKSEKSGFLQWLDEELAMVDDFYKDKERSIYYRFLILEDQFFQLREHKMALVLSSKKRSESGSSHNLEPVNAETSRWTFYVNKYIQPLSRYNLPSLPSMAFLRKPRPANENSSVKMDFCVEEEFDPHFHENQIRNGKLALESDDPDDDSLFSLHKTQSLRSVHSASSGDGEGSRAGEDVPDPRPHGTKLRQQHRKDYVTKKHFGVPYYYARRHLKEALVEHYRSISLIRSYRTMNRTAFRKITKKFDKATASTISGAFMKKVDKEAYFQTSEILDQVSMRVEDMFLTYFDSDKNDRKHGLEKLRSATYAYGNSDIRASSFHETMFFSGLLFGIGLPFFGIALYLALTKTLSHQLADGKYLLQIWGGFFLINLAMFLMGINFVVYNHYKINYKFIFEFNLATALDFRQALLLPSIGFVLLGALSWLSFSDFWPSKLPGRVWPLIYLACVLLIFLWPGSSLYPASRRWLQVALWRILCSGLYPVEFRDFYLGDILCSLTYSFGNLSFFICLYANKWKNVLGGGTVPASSVKCGSRHSRSMGFLASLPSIWRFLQCLRRFLDTGDAFPHLANMTKYLVGAMYYCLLSLWRIERTSGARAAFIVIACVNSIFCSIWDIIMDWSLGQTNSKNFLLRDNLFYNRAGYYYSAMVLDVLLRFQWIFYAFFSTQIQQSAATSFCIALAEILRRFIWMFFRMENEHCANVVLFRASRESPLPYMVSAKVERAIKKLVALRYGALDKFSEDEDVSSENADTRFAAQGKSTAYNRRAEAEEESTVGELGAVERPQKPSRRKSTLFSISNVLNKAHVKDFQRKKYQIRPEDSDDDYDEDDGASIGASIGASSNHEN